MQEIKIPDGHKATILGGTIRIEPIEPKFKRGYIFYYDGCVILLDYIGCNNEVYYVAFYDVETESLCINRHSEYWGYTSDDVANTEATTEEQQLLFDALAKEGKYWDAEALEVKDIPIEEMIKNIFRELRGHNISVNEAYKRMHKLIPINN